MVLFRAVPVAVLVLVVLGCAGADTSPPAQAGLAPVAAELVAEPAPAPAQPASAQPAPAAPKGASSKKPAEPEYLKPVSDFETLSFDVLDLDFKAKKAAFRHTYRPVPVHEGAEVADCAYAGMEPGASVTLGVWDLQKGQVSQWWDVYPPAKQKEQCLASEASSARLAEAKAAFRKLGLDVEAHPRSEQAALNGIRVQEGELDDDLVVRDEVWYGSQLLFSVDIQHGPCGGPDLQIERIWREGDQVLLLQNYDTRLGCAGGIFQERHLGPLLTIP
jgi:hypothetical protein